MTPGLIPKRAPIGPNLEDYNVLEDGIVGRRRPRTLRGPRLK
jgi:hypothetical protein